MPAQLRFKPGGVGQYFDGQITDPGRELIREVHASTCSHCTAVTEYASQRDMMDHVEICRGCMRLICLRCAGKPCDPAEAKAERMEAADRIRRQIHVASWRCY
jgi:hypothetical protein